MGNYLDLPRPLQAVVLVEQLAVQIRAGEATAIRDLYEQTHVRLMRFGTAFSGSESRAAEAVQEAFLDLIRKPGQYDPSRGTPLSFVYGLVRNRLRSARRAEKEVALEDFEPAEENLLPGLEQAQRVLAVQQAIASLPEHYREVILLCEIEECSYEEVASALDLPIGTIRSRLHRAKQLLRIRLEGVAR